MKLSEENKKKQYERITKLTEEEIDSLGLTDSLIDFAHRVRDETIDVLEKAVVSVLIQVLEENPNSVAVIQKIALALELSEENYQDFDLRRLALMRKT